MVALANRGRLGTLSASPCIARTKSMSDPKCHTTMAVSDDFESHPRVLILNASIKQSRQWVVAVLFIFLYFSIISFEFLHSAKFAFWCFFKFSLSVKHFPKWTESSVTICLNTFFLSWSDSSQFWMNPDLLCVHSYLHPRFMFPIQGRSSVSVRKQLLQT